MTRYRAFCARYRHALMTLATISAVFAAMMVITGCAVAPWINDAVNLFPVIGASVISVLSFIAGLSGNTVLAAALAAVAKIINEIGVTLTDIEEMIAAYKETPSETLLQKIEDAANVIVGGLTKILTDTGIPASVAIVIQKWAALVLSQLEAWLAVLPALTTAIASKNLDIPKPADDRLLSAKELQAAFDAIFAEATGDPAVDAALAAVRKH